MDFRFPTSACFFLSAFFAASAASAAPTASLWTDIHAPTAATIKVIGKSGRGSLIAGTSYGFLFRSTDGGESWTRTWGYRTNETPKSIIASGDSLILALYASIPRNMGDCFTCTRPYRSIGVLASRDDGMTWTELDLWGTLAVGAGPQGSIVAAGSVLRVHARGDTAWKPLAFGFSSPPRNNPYPYWAAMASYGSKLIGIYDSLLYSADFLPGQNSVTFYKVMDTAAVSLYPSGPEILVSTGLGLFRYLGSNLGHTGLKLLLDTSKVSGLREADSGFLFGKSGNRLRRGKAQGGPWKAWGPELPEGASAAVWLDQDVIAVGTAHSQPLRSVSEGPWTVFGTGISEFPTDPLLATREAVFASTYQGIMFNRSGGAWSRVDSLGPEKSVSFMAQGNGTIWAGGKSLWRASGDPAHAQWIVPRGIDPLVVPFRYATTGKNILASYYASVGGELNNFLAICPVDGDSCRVTAPGVLGKPRFVSIGFENTVYNFGGIGDTLLAVEGALLHRSMDGGRTWDTLPAGMRIFRYAFLGRRLFSIGYPGEVCQRSHCWQYSDDLGETWISTPQSGPETTGLWDLEVNGGAFYAATERGVFESRDGFAWKDLEWSSAGLQSLAAGDGIIAAGTDDSRILIRELESVGLNQARTGTPLKDPMERVFRNGVLVKDARGIFRRMDGKAATADPPAKK